MAARAPRPARAGRTRSEGVSQPDGSRRLSLAPLARTRRSWRRAYKRSLPAPSRVGAAPTPGPPAPRPSSPMGASVQVREPWAHPTCPSLSAAPRESRQQAGAAVRGSLRTSFPICPAGLRARLLTPSGEARPRLPTPAPSWDPALCHPTCSVPSPDRSQPHANVSLPLQYAAHAASESAFLLPQRRVHGNSPDLRRLRLPAPGRPRSHLSHKQTARNSVLMRSLVGAHFRHNCEHDTKL